MKLGLNPLLDVARKVAYGGSLCRTKSVLRTVDAPVVVVPAELMQELLDMVKEMDAYSERIGTK